jgi:Protein of unknown function (DUF2381)
MLVVLGMVALAPRAGHANPDPGAGPIAMRIIDVPPHGGAYTIDVHPDVLTVLDFPARIERAYSMQQPPAMVMEKHERAVTIMPLPHVDYANVVIETGAFPVSILLRVVARPEDATAQVHFRPFQFEQEIHRRAAIEIERRWANARAELERERADIARGKAELAAKDARRLALVRETALQTVADGLRARHRMVPMSSGARQQHVALRVHRVDWIGDDAFVVFTVENRNRASWLLDDVRLRVSGLERPTVISFPAPGATEERGAIGVVLPGDRERGVAVLRNAALWVGEPVALQVWARDADASADVMPLVASFVLRD